MQDINYILNNKDKFQKIVKNKNPTSRKNNAGISPNACLPIKIGFLQLKVKKMLIKTLAIAII